MKVRQKRIFGFRLAGIFVAVFLLSLAFFLLTKNSLAESIKTVNVSSANSNFTNDEQGSWNLRKSASIIDTENVEYNLKLQSVLKGNGKVKDIYIMLDTSGSMTNERIGQTTNAIRGLGQAMLNDVVQNRIAVAAFNTEAYSVTSGYATDSTNLSLEMMDYMPPAHGGTNYYLALKKIDEFFTANAPDEDRDTIVIFITDGAPVEDHPLEIPEFQALKQKYPNVIFQGLQYEMGDDVIDAIYTISDNQFVSDKTNFEDKLFEAAYDGYKYDQFVVTETINDTYYDIAAVTADLGEVSVSGNVISWDLGTKYRSGLSKNLKIDLQVKTACLEKDDSLCPVSRSTNVKSRLQDTPNENVTSSETPILQFKYNLSYNLNGPEGCTNTVALPEDSKVIFSTMVEISSVKPVCAGYEFKGWAIATDGVRRLNDDYFVMPDQDTEMRAIWASASISKSMDGQIAPMTTATFAPTSFDENSYDNGYYYKFTNTVSNLNNIQAIKLSNGPVNPDYDYSNPRNIFSASDSELPIYGDFDSTTGTFYFFSDADKIYLNKKMDGAFAYMRSLTDISALETFYSENLETLERTFYGDYALADLSPIANWDVDKVTSMKGIFYNVRAATNLDDLSGWVTSSNTNLMNAFRNMTALQNVDGLENWDTTKVTSMQNIFMDCTALTDISGLAGWETGANTSLAGAFQNATALTSVSALSGWETGEVTSMAYIFYSDNRIASFVGLEEWDVKKVTSLEGAFSSTSASSLEPLLGWETDSLTNLSSTFAYASKLTSLHGLEDWDVSDVTTLSMTFSTIRTLEDVSALGDWDVGNVQSMHYMMESAAVQTLEGLENWRPLKVESIRGMFSYCSALNNISALSEWRMPLLSNMSNTFQYSGVSDLTPLSGWNQWPEGTTPTLTKLERTFEHTQVITLNGLENWDMSELTSLYATFADCLKLTNADALASWKPAAITTMTSAFANTKLPNLDAFYNWGPYMGNLTSLGDTWVGDTALTQVNGLRSWRTDKLETMTFTFSSCTSLSDISGLTRQRLEGNDYDSWYTPVLWRMLRTFSGTAIDTLEPLRNWETTSIYSIESAFSDTRVTSLEPLTNWNMSGTLGSIQGAFRGITGVTSLHGLESWNTVNVSDLEEAFYGMTSLSDISALQYWSVGNVEDTRSMFYGDVNIMDYSPLANWNVESLGYMAYMFSECSSTADYSVLDPWETKLRASALSQAGNTTFAYTATDTTILPSWYTY